MKINFYKYSKLQKKKTTQNTFEVSYDAKVKVKLLSHV